MNPADESLKARLAALGVPLSDEVINLALTHRSFAYESGGIPTNERLEFLGDSVIGLVITEELYKRFPEMDESGLSPLRSGVVSTRALSQVARSLGIGREVRIGRGEEVTGGREKNSILADSLEALIGAIYLEHGLEKAEHAIITLMQEAIEEAISRGATLDGKTSLQELVAARGEGSPEYEISESGPDHANCPK
ncbi:MAG: ribonuclease III [Actinobacteria bacterium]|nr:ribonuclease III [Actinomycetota bacterium]